MEPDEAKLITRLKAENKTALKEFFERYRKKVFSLAFGMLHSREDAKDALQDIFFKFFKSIGSFKGKSKLSTWLYRISINTCLDRLKKITRERTEPLVDSSHEISSRQAEENPRDAVIKKELAESVKRAVEKLPLDQKTVFLLREVDGLSYKEIADILHCRIGTVMSRLHYARRALRKDLKPYLE